MKLPITAVLVLAMGLGGCAGFSTSRYNPANWFGKSQPDVVTTLYVPPDDPRVLVAQVTLLKVEPYPGGAIVRATGLPPTEGYWHAELVPQPVDDKGRLVYEFRISPAVADATTGTPYTRQITVAASVSTIKLQGVSSIVVQGSSNALSSRR